MDHTSTFLSIIKGHQGRNSKTAGAWRQELLNLVQSLLAQASSLSGALKCHQNCLVQTVLRTKEGSRKPPGGQIGKLRSRFTQQSVQRGLARKTNTIRMLRKSPEVRNSAVSGVLGRETKHQGS